MRGIPIAGPRGEKLSLIVDDEDYDLVSAFKWHARADGDRFYAHTTLSAHNLLVNYTLTDHVNGDGLDNTKENLREATPRQNSWNRGLRSDSGTGYKGVSKRRTAYIARIQVDGKREYLGWFKSPVDAAKAYDAAAREHYGEFARLNFPAEGGDA